jgi:hypothetical protein
MTVVHPLLITVPQRTGAALTGPINLVYNAGEGGPVNLTLVNTGNVQSSFNVRLTGTAVGFTTIGAGADGSLDASISRIINLEVQIPAGTAAGDYNLTVETLVDGTLDTADGTLVITITVAEEGKDGAGKDDEASRDVMVQVALAVIAIITILVVYLLYTNETKQKETEKKKN